MEGDEGQERLGLEIAGELFCRILSSGLLLGRHIPSLHDQIRLYPVSTLTDRNGVKMT